MADDPTSSILRGVRALVGLAELGKPVSFGVLAEALELPPSSAHRILAVLRQAGYVHQDPLTGSYSPGSAFLRAATTFGAASTFPQAVHDTLDAVVSQSGESAFYGAYLAEIQRFRFVTVRFSKHAVQYVSRSDQLYSVLWGASGRAIAAFLPESTLKTIYDRDKSSAEGNVTLPAWSEFKKEMAELRQRGFCSSTNQRFEGAHSTAAPVLGFNQQVIGSLGIAMPSLRKNTKRVAEFAQLVLDATQHLSTVAQCSMDPQSLVLRPPTDM